MDMTIIFTDDNLNQRAVRVENAKDVEAGKALAWKGFEAICEDEGWDINDFGISQILTKQSNEQYKEYLNSALDPRD